jgi:hypothetical protein
VTVASAAIAMCGCGGIVVVQRMVMAMKWQAGCPGTCRSLPAVCVCRGSVACDTTTDVAAAVAVAVAVMAQVFVSVGWETASDIVLCHALIAA